MRILIIDDSIDKIINLSKLIYEIVPEAKIETSENIVNALSLLESNENYNLAVIDLLLPLRINEEPKKDGGEFLLREIYGKPEKYNTPNYLIGFTQHDDDSLNFSNIWKTLKYSPESQEWKNCIRTLLNHISKTHFTNTKEETLLPTIYVEGLTDKLYLESAINLFFQDYKDKINIVSQKNAGANWVANQVPIWAMKMQKDKQTGAYKKAIGLLDSDSAGNKAKENIQNRNLSDNENKCFKLVQLNPSYNEEIKKYYQLGCKVEIEIETLFPIETFIHAENQKWLEHRAETFISPPKDWKQYEETSLQYIKRKGVDPTKLLYLKKIKMAKKQDFSNYIEGLPKKETYSNFKILIKNLLESLDFFKN